VALERLKPAATALIVTSVLELVGLVLGLLFTLGLLFLLPMAGLGASIASSFSNSFKFWGSPLPIVGAVAGVAVALLATWLALNVAADVYVISAARRMMAGRDLRRARRGSIVAIVLGALGLLTTGGSSGSTWFFGLWALLQLSAGVWALVLLRSPEVSCAFSDSDSAPDSLAATASRDAVEPSDSAGSAVGATPASLLLAGQRVDGPLGAAIASVRSGVAGLRLLHRLQLGWKRRHLVVSFMVGVS
jgi:hypothetical protein